MIAASKNYMGLNANTCKIEVKGLVCKKRNQCKLTREAFEQEREYWKDDVSNEVVEQHNKSIIQMLDSGIVPLEKLQAKTTIGADPQTGYKEKTAWYQPGHVLGMKYNKRECESTPPFYLAKQTKQGDLWFTEDPTQIDYSKYKERLQTAIKAIQL
jgi:DNA polymerase elongation subunit (family B)